MKITKDRYKAVIEFCNWYTYNSQAFLNQLDLKEGFNKTLNIYYTYDIE